MRNQSQQRCTREYSEACAITRTSMFKFIYIIRAYYISREIHEVELQTDNQVTVAGYTMIVDCRGCENNDVGFRLSECIGTCSKGSGPQISSHTFQLLASLASLHTSFKAYSELYRAEFIEPNISMGT